MGNTDGNKDMLCIAGAYGPMESVPLLSDLIGSKLLDMVAIAYSKLGSPSGILQNDGRMFPLECLIRLFKKYCRAIRSTSEGRLRCLASDCQAVMNFGGGNQVHPGPDLEERMKKFPIEAIGEFGLPEEGVYCYRCHAGLVEFVRAISLDSKDEAPFPIGAVLAGQNRVKGYSLTGKQVEQIAIEIGHPHPKELAMLYTHMKLTVRTKLLERARNLAETGRPIEDSATMSFHTRKQAQFDDLASAALGGLRLALSQTEVVSTTAVQQLVISGMEEALKRITSTIRGSYSALCRVGEPVDPRRGDRVQVEVVAHAGVCKRKLEKIYIIHVQKNELHKVLRELAKHDDFKPFSSNSLYWEFFAKLKSAIQVENISHVVVSDISTPPYTSDRLLWFTLLCDNCDVLAPRRNPLPGFVKMLGTISENTRQIVSMAYLLSRQKDAVATLIKHQDELEKRRNQTRFLIRDLAHQVSRPIMELKQSAYILSLGFSKEAYDGFRACLAELERGCRNFDLYEKMTTDFDNRGFDLQGCRSFDIKEIVLEARNRVKPYLRAERRELEISAKVAKGYTIPNVIVNPDLVLECFVNVLHNAIKYSIGNRPIEMEIFQREPSTVDTRITNYGIGLPENEWEKIFEATYRADTAKAVCVEGTGLGLYISRRLISLHGGSIKVESCVPTRPTDDGMARWRTTFLLSLKSS